MKNYSLLLGGSLAALSVKNGVRLAGPKARTPKQFKKLLALTLSQEKRAEKLLGLRAINW